jgi:hypothetical protein
MHRERGGATARLSAGGAPGINPSLAEASKPIDLEVRPGAQDDRDGRDDPQGHVAPAQDHLDEAAPYTAVAVDERIVGGSDAGTEAALRARQTDPSLEINLLVADGFLDYSICGLPFFLSGEVDD